jgi:hypothetical protein
MDRMVELNYGLHRINNGSPAKRDDLNCNLSAEWWSIVGQLIEHRRIIIPNDEKLIAQLTSRRKLYDSRSREKLESKADLASRGVESPDRADALSCHNGPRKQSLLCRWHNNAGKGVGYLRRGDAALLKLYSVLRCHRSVSTPTRVSPDYRRR